MLTLDSQLDKQTSIDHGAKPFVESELRRSLCSVATRDFKFVARDQDFPSQSEGDGREMSHTCVFEFLILKMFAHGNSKKFQDALNMSGRAA
ncbi:uncharacterized protein N7473_010339 [Penicillium subrubescens]|uniref:uncharacterized protein n=1 Tax=Penicillium subrubescens TaxID=1316194 RepID=UPI0025454851|nr:uncharacterized protein N7473_010339 [Penicillium subrubescens]KAJ5883453.1 hypothetical protein N7473_010339 [Penicillium subrubescens]